MFQNVADGLIVTDEAGNIALINKPASLLTGWGSEEAKGLPVDDVFRLSDETTGRPVSNAAAPGFHAFILSPRGDFDPPIIEAEISENRDEGKTFGVIIAFRDITERRKAERRDRQIQKMNALTLMATGLGRELAELQSRMDESIKFLIENTQGETARLLWDVFVHSLQQQTRCFALRIFNQEFDGFIRAALDSASSRPRPVAMRVRAFIFWIWRSRRSALRRCNRGKR